MPTQKESAFVRGGRELLKTGKHLCETSRERIERGKRLRKDLSERTSREDSARRRAGRSE